ncbi:hypothetical protein POM88_020058 [Heracleum sosnowskyi]|uniref:DUF4283 domain-containing protein n=1 Tax=Heracleum sosnowskyi TaxID=360622 RepID=A0AAD8MSF7_9APIA|nr:hypothetical protein POM88_020058 [Heracleum sosnowskyi]
MWKRRRMKRRQRDVGGERRNFEFQTRSNGRMSGWDREWHQEGVINTRESEWKEVVAVSEDSWEEVKREALFLKVLMDKEAITAAEKGNKEILRYLINRIYRIKRTIGLKDIQQVIDGDSNAIERALRKMLLCKWEGPVVKYLNDNKQEIVEKGEDAHRKFIFSNLEWVDRNRQALETGGDKEGLRMASNQIHYNSLRNLKKKEYEYVFNSRTYAQALLNNGKGNIGDTEREILQTALMEEGMKEFSIKEIACWKFLIIFKNSEKKNSFDKNRVKSWLHDIREVEDEDLRIKRKLVVELRGIPCTAWTEINLMELTKELGDWGWWMVD